MVVHETQFQSERDQPVRTPSLVYSFLPSALQSRLQPLALVRRGLSDYSLRSRKRVTSLVMFRSENEDTMVAGDEIAVASTGSVESTEVPGICWRFAPHGSHTLQITLAESQSSDPQRQAFSRQLYFDAMAYLIQGLPSDLTDQERLRLKNTLPESLRNSTPPETSPPRKHNPSLLHRSLASIIIAICLLLRLALPYIRLFIAMAYSYDRAHHVRERIFAFSVTAADSFGKRSMALASTAMANEVVLGTVTYWVDGIRGGLNEGFGEGLKVIETQNEP